MHDIIALLLMLEWQSWPDSRRGKHMPSLGGRRGTQFLAMVSLLWVLVQHSLFRERNGRGRGFGVGDDAKAGPTPTPPVSGDLDACPAVGDIFESSSQTGTLPTSDAIGSHLDQSYPLYSSRN